MNFYNVYIIKLLIVFVFSISLNSYAQTQPAPQDISAGYSQNFNSFTGTGGSEYPAGFQGWIVASSLPGTGPRTNAPISNLSLRQSGTAASTNTGIYDYNGKIGILSSSFNDLALAFSMNTSSVTSPKLIQVTFDAMVMRNLYNGTDNNILNTLVIQYRIGTTGDFTNINNTVKNGTNTVSSGTVAVDSKTFTFTLPSACINQPVVQLRWLLRTVSGSLGSRPAFAIDNLNISSITPAPEAPFTGFMISTKNIKVVSGTTYATKTLSGVTRTAAVSAYGGDLSAKKDNTKRFFVTYKNPDNDTWYLLDPDGYVFYSTAVNAVVAGGGVDPVNQLRSIKANTIGNFSDETITVMPYTSRLNLGSTYTYADERVKALYANGVFPVFDPAFVTFAQDRASSLIKSAKINDKNLVGYFSDNEVLLANPASGDKLITIWLNTANYGGSGAAASDPNYLAAVNWMKSRHGGSLTNPNQADIDEWPGFLAEQYYRICRDVIKAIDNNHLYLGSRLHQDLKNPYLFAAAGKYLDVVSVNNYNVWTDADMNARFNVWANASNKPFMIGEFYAMAKDSGLPNEEGAGYKVFTQQDRADFFEHYTMNALKHKASVGFQFFKYRDDPASSTDPSVGSNKGLLNTDYEWWEPMKESFTKVCKDVYRLRDYLITGNQTLPLKLEDFTATLQEDKVLLRWQTSDEVNTDIFEVQRAVDGKNFTTFAKIKNKGNFLNTYESTDLNPNEGTNYYRLIQHDLNGEFSLSNVRSVNYKPLNQSRSAVFPNPSSGNINLILKDQNYGTAKVSITNLTGQLVYQKTIQLTSQTSYTINPTVHLTPGQYLINVQCPTFKETLKLMIQ